MDTSWGSGLVTLIGTIGGFWFAGWNQERTDRRAAQRELETERRAGTAEAARQRHKFQLDTLLALQEEVQMMGRLHGRTLHFDHMQARKGLATQLPEPWSEEMFANSVSTRRLATRVLEERVRDAVEEYSTECTSLTLKPITELHGEALEREAERKMTRLGIASETVTEELGRAVRAALTWEAAAARGMTAHIVQPGALEGRN